MKLKIGKLYSCTKSDLYCLFEKENEDIRVNLDEGEFFLVLFRLNETYKVLYKNITCWITLLFPEEDVVEIDS